MSSYSFNGLSAPALALASNFTAENGVIELFGSFQGATSTAGPVQTSANATTCVGFRGSWFTVSSINTGWYRVQLVGLNISTSLVPVNTTASTNGQPNGLLGEPLAWLVSDGAASSSQSSTAGYQCVVGNTTTPNGLFLQCSRFDPGVPSSPAPQSFDIFCYQPQQTGVTTAGTALQYVLTNVPSTQRVCFLLAYKALAATP